MYYKKSLSALELSISNFWMLKAGPMVISGLPIEGIKGWGKMTLEIRELSPCLNWIAQHSCMILAIANVWPWGPSRVSPDPEAKKSTTFVPLLSAICNKVHAPN